MTNKSVSILATTTSETSTSDSQQLANDNNGQHTSSDSTIIAITAALGTIAGLSYFVISILLVILIIQRKRRNNGNAAFFTDSGPVAYSKPWNSKKTRPAALPRKMASNPIYEGQNPVYEETPGEAIKDLISPANGTPCTSADITPRYFDLHMSTNAPSLPPPRNGSVTMLPKLETVDEIDAMKAAIKNGKIPQSGDEYMIMGGPKPDKKMDIHDADSYKSNAEEVYEMIQK